MSHGYITVLIQPMSSNIVITQVIGTLVDLFNIHLTQGKLETDTTIPIPVIAQSQTRQLSLYLMHFVIVAQSF